MKELIDYLKNNDIKFEENISLRKKTWIKTGGIVAVWIEPNTTDELTRLSRYFFEKKLNYEVVGHTSNVFYLDTTNPSIIVSTKRLTSYQLLDSCVSCDCGVHVSTLSRSLVKKGFKGFSGLVNLPGTIGAATVNNSSCFNSQISSLIKNVTLFDKSTGKIKTINVEELRYSHRSSSLKRKEIDAVVISVRLNVIQGNITEEIQKAEKATEIRKLTQEPPAYTLGSVFANLKERNNMGFRIFRRFYNILAVMHIVGSISRTRLLLKYYGYDKLHPYVSDKNVNTFIWKPEIKDKSYIFSEYCRFMEKAFINPRLEIEVR